MSVTDTKYSVFTRSNKPCLCFHATADALEEGEGHIHRRSRVRRCKCRAFVDGVAKDQWLRMMVRLRCLSGKMYCRSTYHFRHLSLLKTSSIVLEQSNTISDRAEPRHILAVPDDIVKLVVVGLLHAFELCIGVESITTKLLCQDGESCRVGRVELAGRAGLRDDAGYDGIFRVGIAVRVRSIAAGRLAPEDHVIWITAGEVLDGSMSINEDGRILTRKLRRCHAAIPHFLVGQYAVVVLYMADTYTILISARPALTGAARAPG